MKHLWLSLLCLAACAKHVPPPKAPEPPPPHEEPAPKPEHDDGMQIEGQLGTISDEAIGHAFQEKWPDIARCSQVAQMRFAYLNGTIELKIRVGKDGAPLKAYVERSTLGNWDAEHCVLEVARTITFPSPKGGNEAELTFPIEIKPKHGSVIAWEESRIAPTAERSRADAGVCRGDAPVGKAGKGKKRPNTAPVAVKELPPNVSLTVYIAPGGHISSVGLAGEGPIDEQFAQCLVSRARTWRADDPRGRVAKATIGIE